MLGELAEDRRITVTAMLLEQAGQMNRRSYKAGTPTLEDRWAPCAYLVATSCLQRDSAAPLSLAVWAAMLEVGCMGSPAGVELYGQLRRRPAMTASG